MSWGAFGLILAAALQPAATEPQGPPSPTPLTAQSGATPAIGPAPEAKASAPTPFEPIQPPAPTGQAATGATAYPASFFASALPNTARDMIDRLPGFVFDNGDSVRGFAGAAGNVLVDGARPTSKTDDLDSFLRRIPASQVLRIDVIRGGAPGIDMQGKTVVANVVRTRTTGTTGLVSLGGNWIQKDGRQTPVLRLEESYRDNGTAIEGSLLAAGFADDGAGEGPETEAAPNGQRLSKTRDNTKGGGAQVIATGAYTTPLFGGSIKINLQVMGQQYIYDERDQDVSDLAAQPDVEHDHQNQEQSELDVTYDRNFGARLSTETLLIQQLQGEDSLSTFSEIGEVDRFREGHTNGETVLRSSATYTPTTALTFEGGGEGDFNFFDSRTTYLVDGVAQVVPAADDQITEERGEVFAKATWVVSPHWTLEAGLRLEASKLSSRGDLSFNKTLIYPKPRVVVTWSPETADQVRLRVEEEVSQLDFNNFTAAAALTTGQVYAGNPNLNPQQALVYEAAYEHRFWSSGDVSVTLRHSRLTDVIDRAPILSSSGDFDAPANIGGGYKNELISALNLPIDRFHIPGGLIKANLTWRSSGVTDPTTGQARPISGLRPREGEIDFSQDLPKWKITYGGAYKLGWRQPYYRFDEIEFDTFRNYFSIYAEYKPKPDLSIRMEIDDIGADFRRTLEVFPDLRSDTVQQYTDIRNLYFGPTIFFRVRKSY